MKQPNFDTLVQRFRRPKVSAMVLMGSHARGDAGPFSDVDLVRFVSDDFDAEPDSGSHMIEGTLVVVSNVPPSEAERWFTEPEAATQCMAGVRSARALWDPGGYFAPIQQRAQAFVWDSAMQDKANAYASRELVGLVEEVHKGLEGLRRNDPGRLLNARFGLSWLLTALMRVQRGILVTGDNQFLSEVIDVLGEESAWARYARQAFGVKGSGSLRDQVHAGLQLYTLTANLMADVVAPDDREIVQHTVKAIQQIVG